MEVECLHLDENMNCIVHGPYNMKHFVSFERDINDFLSTFRIVQKVRGLYLCTIFSNYFLWEITNYVILILTITISF